MKNKFNYSGRLNNQLLGMAYNPGYSYVLSAVMELMDKKGIRTRNITKEGIHIPGCTEQSPTDSEIPEIDLKTYNEIMIAARLFTFVGLNPSELTHYSISFLGGIKTEFVPFEEDPFECIESDGEVLFEIDPESDFGWLFIGENKEIMMAAKVTKDEGVVVPITDLAIRSRYGDMQLAKHISQYNGEEFGFEYISELFDYLYEPRESYEYEKSYDNYLTDIEYDEETYEEYMNDGWDEDEDDEKE